MSLSRAAHPATSPELLRALLFDEDEAVREAAFANPSLRAEDRQWAVRVGAFRDALTEPGETFHDWNGAVVGGAPGRQVRAGIPLEARLTEAELEPLLGLGPFARALWARHPATPPSRLRQLADDPSPHVRDAVLARTEDPAVLDAMTGDVRVWRSRFVAPATLARHAGDPREPVRAAIAAHVNCAPAVLCRLAKDPQPRVRQAVAGNPHTPAEALRALAGEARCREHVMENPSTPADLRHELLMQQATHRDWLTRARAASSRLPLPEDLAVLLAADGTTRVRAALAGNWHLSRGAFERLAVDPAGEVRRAVAENRNCPADLLDRLAEDPDVNVRVAVRR